MKTKKLLLIFLSVILSLMATPKETASHLKRIVTVEKKECSGNTKYHNENPNYLSAKRHRVHGTIYHPVKSQCDGDPLVTADGTKIKLEDLKAHRIHYAAVSRDLLYKYKFGSRFRILNPEDPRLEGVIFEVHDLMGPRHKDRIDILQHPESKLKGSWEKMIIEKV